MVGETMSGPVDSHSGQSATTPPRGPSTEPCWQHGSGAGEGRKKKEGDGKLRWISIALYNIRDGRTGGL